MDAAKLLKAKEGENIEFKEAKPHFDFEEIESSVSKRKEHRGFFR